MNHERIKAGDLLLKFSFISTIRKIPVIATGEKTNGSIEPASIEVITSNGDLKWFAYWMLDDLIQ